MAGIKEQLKAGTLGRLYLLYGEEAYLKTYYSERILHLLLTPEDEMMNCDVLEGSNATADAILQSGQTLPFLAEKRLVLVRDSQAFKGGREFEPLLLSRSEFMRIHRSYIVNMLQIRELSSAGVQTFSGQSLPVSRLLYPQLQKDYMALLFEQREG